MLFCQDKEIGVGAMERKRIEYIDWLRIISAIAVIGIHITMTQPNNYSVQEIGKSNYTILTCVYTLIQWAVPVFLMISGNLLLHSNKLAFTKVKKMSLRMGAVLLLFGSVFALLEQVFERKTLEIGMLPNSVLMTLQQKSWSHLWYLYILIGIYLILIPLKRFTPTNFPLLGIGFAIPLLWFIVFLLSWGATFIMLKIPGLKDLL